MASVVVLHGELWRGRSQDKTQGLLWSARVSHCLHRSFGRDREVSNVHHLSRCGVCLSTCVSDCLATCLTVLCPSVHGGWSDWRDWMECSASCIAGSNIPSRIRRRSCSNPTPSADTTPPGNRCPGDELQHQGCRELPNCAGGTPAAGGADHPFDHK